MRKRKHSLNRDYQDILYKTWRADVRKRDGYKCRWLNCKCKTKLQVHHILKWADYPLMKYTINNGITLCKQHHDFLKGQEETYQEFLFKCLSSP